MLVVGLMGSPLGLWVCCFVFLFYISLGVRGFHFDLLLRVSACSKASISKKNCYVYNIYFHNKIIDDKFTNFPIMPVEYIHNKIIIIKNHK